ncbi:MAG: hypothetical protein U1A77_12375 [Pirellulales bacterium]
MKLSRPPWPACRPNCSTNNRRPTPSFRRTCFSRESSDFIADGIEPYHSKYNPVERCWSCLERHWNGTLLTDVNTVLQWAQTMTWKGLHPIVQWVTTTYERGKRISRQAFAPLAQRLQRSETLPRWSVLIEPLRAGPAPAE